MKLNFKDRVAFHYMVATAIIIALVFGIIFFSVQKTVMGHLDDDLYYEAHKHIGEIKFNEDSLLFVNKAEWEEREHREIQVHPVFIQLINPAGKTMDKSPNLKEDQLVFNAEELGNHFNTQLNNRLIRQVQLPIHKGEEIKGYIIAAMSSEAAHSVIIRLRNVLIISYLTVILGLYFISRYLAGRSIRPVQEMTKTITRITQQNLTEGVDLPHHQDEIYELSASFNALLSRIEKAIQREKQFTSDASHELRTPLATLRGTLEVLIRKPRTQQEYEDKIQDSLAEINRMANILEQLLLLARLDTSSLHSSQHTVPLPTIIDESLSRHKQQITDKNIAIKFHFDTHKELLVPHYYTTLMIDNLLDNAIKYSPSGATIWLTAKEENQRVVCSIRDEGIGIKEEDLGHIFDHFFRSDALQHKHIQGNGLGLSIVQKCANAIKAHLSFHSHVKQGTTATIQF